jgi:hypothetical protein
MGAVAILLVFILLIALGVGGYFGYKKLYVPRQCNNRAATANVATWVWNSNVCQANTCATGFTLNADSSDCVKTTARTYSSLGSNACATNNGQKLTVDTKNPTSTDACGQDCDLSDGCMGFNWNTSSSTPACSFVTGGAAALDTTETSGKQACYAPK